MKLIIAGSRHIKLDYSKMVEILKDKIGPDWNSKITEIVSGNAAGIDTCGEQVSEFACINLKRFCAEWVKYGRRAGPIRNNKMAVYGDALLLIWDGKSSGSQHMKNAMIDKGKPIYEVILLGE